MPRVKTEVPLPSHNLPLDTQVWDSNGIPNISFLRHHFFSEGRLTTSQLERICLDACQILKKEPNLLTLPTPITVCGDIHGQYYDLMQLFDLVGGVDSFEVDPTSRILFLGDYVDRGCFSIECYLLLLALKIKHPKQVWLLRGNHECRHLTAYFTFKKECRFKYDEKSYNIVCDSFDHLPLAAVVDEKFFCVHGGISPSLDKVSDVNKFSRFCDPPKKSIFCDLLWADPHESYGNEDTKSLFTHNRTRGCSFSYTFAGVSEFLSRNNLLAVVRGHEAQENGYKLYKKGTQSGFPTVVTLFSAPNYVDTYRNKAAVLRFDGKLFSIKQFRHSPHPYTLPNFLDAITWSGSFVAEKIVEILVALLNTASGDSGVPVKLSHRQIVADEERKMLQEASESGAQRLRKQLQTIGRLQQRLVKLRVAREGLCEISKMFLEDNTVDDSPSGQSDCLEVVGDVNGPCGAGIESFADAKISDRINERLPPSNVIGIESASMHPDLSYKPELELKRNEVTEEPDCVITQAEIAMLSQSE